MEEPKKVLQRKIIKWDTNLSVSQYGLRRILNTPE